MAKLPIVMLSVVFLRHSFSYVLLVLLCRGGSLILGATSLSLLLAWLSGNVPEKLLAFFALTKESYLIPLIAIATFLCASVLTFFANITGIKGVFYFERHLYLEKKVSSISVDEFRGIHRVLASVLDALIPSVFFIAICALWSLKYLFALPVFAIIFICGFYLARLATRLVSEKYQRNVQRIREERRADKAEIFATAVPERPFYGMLMVPQLVILAMHLVVAVLVTFGIIVGKEFLSSEENVFISMLPFLTLVSLMQLTSVATLIVKVGVFSELIQRLVAELTGTPYNSNPVKTEDNDLND